MEADTLPAASATRGRWTSPFIGSQVDPHKSHSAERPRGTRSWSSLHGLGRLFPRPRWARGRLATSALRQVWNRRASGRTQKWDGSQPNPDDLLGWSVAQGLSGQSCRSFLNRLKDPPWPRADQGDPEGTGSEVVWKDSRLRLCKTWHRHQPQNQDRNSPKMEVSVKSCAFVDYAQWPMLRSLLWKGWL